MVCLYLYSIRAGKTCSNCYSTLFLQSGLAFLCSKLVFHFFFGGHALRSIFIFPSLSLSSRVLLNFLPYFMMTAMLVTPPPPRHLLLPPRLIIDSRSYLFTLLRLTLHVPTTSTLPDERILGNETKISSFVCPQHFFLHSHWLIAWKMGSVEGLTIKVPRCYSHGMMTHCAYHKFLHVHQQVPFNCRNYSYGVSDLRNGSPRNSRRCDCSIKKHHLTEPRKLQFRGTKDRS